MQQLDWVGEQPKKPFKDIRNQRDEVAETKAVLLKQLGDLCNKVPEKLRTGGTINDVRDWKRRREEAMKVAGNKRASVSEISSAINSMLR